MDIYTLPILSEVFGDEGSGRSSFCFCVSKSSNSLWIEGRRKLSTQRAYSLRMDLETIYIMRVKNIQRLIHSLQDEEIYNFIQDHKIEILIINGIEDLEEIGTKNTNNYIEVVQQLKILYLRLRVKSVIITGLSETSQKCAQHANHTTQRSTPLETTDNLQNYIEYGKHFKSNIPKSSINGIRWEYSMPTKIYIKKTNNPSIRTVEIVKPSVPHPVKYVLEISQTEITIYEM